jgi:hypothetical protein
MATATAFLRLVQDLAEAIDRMDTGLVTQMGN